MEEDQSKLGEEEEPVNQFWLKEEGIESYLKMIDGCDGSFVISKLKNHLEAPSSILEIGSGPGKDMKLLSDDGYIVTGSDFSPLWMDKFEGGESSDYLLLDCSKMDLPLSYNQFFDCIYSNKVMMHLTKEDMLTSLRLQADKLRDGGLIVHALWRGEEELEYFHHGMRNIYYSIDQVEEMIGDRYDLIEKDTYTEDEENDSFYFVARKK